METTHTEYIAKIEKKNSDEKQELLEGKNRN